MAKIYPFRALRYDPAKVSLQDVVTQPYDKITPAMQQAYYDRSKYNLIHVILGKKEQDDTDAFAILPNGEPQHNVYTRAAQALTSWRRKNVLRQEPEPALYAYTQTYQLPGSSDTQAPQERRGFIALGQLYDYADHVVYRHEQTFPKHKSDRLALFKATRTYCEQIYMLYSDPAFTVDDLLFSPARPAELEITDELHVTHRVWKVTDVRLLNLIVTAMADKKLIIADGHHRYETSVTYMHERAAQLGLANISKTQGPAPETWDASLVHEEESPSHRADEPHALLPQPAFPEAAMMMTFVNMDAPGITILPTHRVVFGLDKFSPEGFFAEAAALFTVEKVDTGTLGTPDLTLLDRSDQVAFLAVTRAGTHLMTAKPDQIATILTSLNLGISERQAQLDVVQLHRVVLEHLLRLSHESIANTENIRYLRDATEAAVMVAQGKADIAFLIRAVTLDQLKNISLSGDVMPQKSTDFYPKLLSGLALYALD